MEEERGKSRQGNLSVSGVGRSEMDVQNQTSRVPSVPSDPASSGRPLLLDSWTVTFLHIYTHVACRRPDADRGTRR
jgi:hypothetical protein